MPNNINERGLTDREMLQLCLELEKGRCRSIGNTMLETSHTELRDLYRTFFESADQNQVSLYELMSSKGWYKTDQASAEQVTKVQEFMQNNLHPDHNA
ncbi:spore coat protein [Halalkalibacter akibai]|uniref:Spore coat protein n=1 Tax=Halalkalibacter akibai (strain ATCC 43226 / DSM 21942 / CIP 109018 / JCM 9157 / 1139) TaxID=1236973 RepID=W4QUJ0_HALA3|nr:spore coat protein [Halalkalibacter akibai]GAE35283.1 hypothetical protein JCM9157_2384 [Halalkalibacter akibai JCM 9157]